MRARAAFQVHLGWYLRELAGMAAGAALGERNLAATQNGIIVREVCRSSRSIGKMMRPCALEHEEREVDRLVLSGEPVARVLTSHSDLDRRDLLAANQRVEVLEPLFAEKADVEVDAVQRSKCANGVCAVLQDVGRVNDVGRLEIPS